MEKKVLQSMIDFVIERHNDQLKGAIESFIDCVGYANFLKQKLELWMFVPCRMVDGVWMLIEEPKEPCGCYGACGRVCKFADDMDEYQQAKDRVLFIINNGELNWERIIGISWIITRYITIENMVNNGLYKFELTDSAIKQIYG